MSKGNTAALDHSAVLPPDSRWRVKQSWLMSFGVVKKMFTLSFGRDALGLNLLAFLLGRVSIMGELIPFGLAYFITLARTRPVNAIAVGIWTLAGSISAGFLAESAWYAAAMLIFYMLFRRESRLQKRFNAIHLAVGCTLLLAAVTLLFWQQITLYQLMLAGFVIATTTVLTVIFSYALPLLRTDGQAHVTEERLLCLIVVLSAAIAGLGQAQYMGFSLRNMVSSFFIMTMIQQGGAGLGVSVGAAVGIISDLNDGNIALLIAYYAVASLFGGAFNILGKFAIALGYLTGCVIAVSYFNANVLFPTLVEAAAGTLVFLAMPSGWRDTWKREQTVETSSPDRGLAVANVKLRQISDVFADLAGAFAHPAESNTEAAEDIRQVVDNLGRQVCKTCGQKELCWEKQFYNTYQSFLDLLSMPPGIKIETRSLPHHLRLSCLRQQELSAAAADIVEHKRVQMFWQKRTLECRSMLAEQMRSARDIVANLAEEILNAPKPDKRTAEELAAATRECGCELESISVSGKGGELEIIGRKKPCSGDQECIIRLAPVIAEKIGKRVSLSSKCGSKALRRKCSIVCKTASRFAIAVGAAAIAKGVEGISGDTSLVTEAGHGRVAAIISDGMGSGPTAASESQTAVRYMEKLLSAGFSAEAAVKSVNSMLLLRLPGECYTTMDIAIFDLYNGEVEFIKTGSAISYIKRVKEVSIVQGTSLPAGLMEHVDVEPERRKLAIGDTVVMVSDGVADADRQKQRRDWIANFLRLAPDDDPQKLANELLEQAKKLAGAAINDDMTVLVIKLHGRLGVL